QAVVAKPLAANDNLLLVEVDRFDLALTEPKAVVAGDGTCRVLDVPWLHQAGGDLIEHRREQVEVDPVDERDVEGNTGPGEAAKLDGAGEAAEPGPEDQHAGRTVPRGQHVATSRTYA